MLKVTNLRKVYGSGETATEAIADLSSEVKKGEFVCIVGSSGAGKTTLLKTVSGLMAPTAGDVELAGEKVSGPPERMALVFQDYSRSLYPWMKVSENVAFPLRRKKMSKQERNEVVAHAVESVGLASASDKYPWQLSGGMQQRVAIARGLAYQPEILLMDEPFASVDAQTRADLEDLVLDVHERFGITVVFVTHDIDESVYLADRIVVLSHRPTTVKEIVSVPLARPRDQIATKELPAFIELRSRVIRQIKGETEEIDDTNESDDVPAGVAAAREEVAE
jgi:NitT/TauT family transport system ATP-binding protein